MWINWWARFYPLLELYILSAISSTMESLRIKLQQIALKTESALPIIIVVCSVTVAVFVPFSISNSHAIHTPGRKKYLKLLTGLSISFNLTQWKIMVILHAVFIVETWHLLLQRCHRLQLETPSFWSEYWHIYLLAMF